MVKEFITEIEKQRKEIDAKHEADMKAVGYREDVSMRQKPISREEKLTDLNNKLSDPQDKNDKILIKMELKKRLPDFSDDLGYTFLRAWDHLKQRDKVRFLMSIGIKKSTAYRVSNG